MKHYYQPTNFSCVQTACAIFLSAYGIHKNPQEIVDEVPVRSWPGKDEPAGTPNQDIAAYLCRIGFDVEIISFDIWITDLSWQGKNTGFIKSKLEQASGKLTAPMIGRDGTELYIQAYLDYIKAGGKLSVQVAATSQLLTDLLEDGPVMATVAYGTLHGMGKTVNGPGVGEFRMDDLSGISPNHNIVISRVVDEKFEIYDPWLKPGVHLVDKDRLVAAVATAQQECDNMLLIARPVSG